MNLLVQEIVRMGERQLKEAGIENYKQEAEMLYCHLMKIDRAKFILRWSKEATERETNQYLDLCGLRASRVPLQHILGQVEFMGLPFIVKPGVLIPRHDTEVLAGIAKEKIKEKSTVLDLCCGSGILGIFLAKEHSCKVTCADISKDALELTAKNAGINGVKVNTFETDMFQGLGRKKFNAIVCNPPYISEAEIANLEIEVREHDPKDALSGGASGLDFYHIIAREAANYLKKKGILALEIGHDQGQSVQEILLESEKFTDIEIFQDLQGRDRVITCIRL